MNVLETTLSKDKNQSRKCLNCNSTSTSIGKQKSGKLYAHWYRHEDGWICKKCRNKLIDNPVNNPRWNKISHEKWNPIYAPRILDFKGKAIIMKEAVRTGTCFLCKKKIGDEFVNCDGVKDRIKITNIHHIEYHENDPLKDTVELCASCHAKESWRLRLD